MPSKELPMVIHAVKDINCLEWGMKFKPQLNELLLDQGAILLRGFKIGSAHVFGEMFSAIVGEPMEYRNRTSPRERVDNNIYTSTSHPSDQYIQMHTENSYSLTYNRIIAFYCLVPPRIGGETPIADERKLLRNLKKETVKKFVDKKILYLRNTIPGIGLDWKTIYQTDDRKAVNKYLESNGFEYAWITDDHLRVKWTLPAFQKHPISGEELWFNHMFFGLKTHYPQEVLEYFSESDLPFSTYYGDGSEIEKPVVQEFKEFYANNSIVFKWQKDDFLVLDNMMFSHGRNPFEGPRTILTAMAQPYAFTNNPTGNTVS
ncbi:MAG: taurine catabolism dioxygenase TauD [Marivirga sp.]|nr:taurine catabolism dioxygenase TauD [Marivirga sp.]